LKTHINTWSSHQNTRVIAFWAGFAIVFAVPAFWGELIRFGREAPKAVVHGIEIAALWPWNPMTVTAAIALALFAGPVLLFALRLLAIGLLRIFLKAPALPARPPHAKSRLRIPGADGLAARLAWARAAAAWKAQPAPPDVSDLRPGIELLKKHLDGLASERETAIRACAKAETEDAQRPRYLGTFRIEDARLSNLGPARCAVLRSWGIDTAADIDEVKIAIIPGFGKSLTDKLVIWRAMKEKAFIPITAAIIDPHDVQRIDRTLSARRIKLMKDLREKIAEVERRLEDYVKERDARWAHVEAAYQRRLACR
jgi:hypothetical protein